MLPVKKKTVDEDEIVDFEWVNLRFSSICIFVFLTAKLSIHVVFLPVEFCVIVHGLNAGLLMEYFCPVQLQLWHQAEFLIKSVDGLNLIWIAHWAHVWCSLNQFCELVNIISLRCFNWVKKIPTFFLFCGICYLVELLLKKKNVFYFACRWLQVIL